MWPLRSGYDEPPRAELLEAVAELGRALALGRFIGEALDDALAVRVGLEPAEAP